MAQLLGRPRSKKLQTAKAKSSLVAIVDPDVLDDNDDEVPDEPLPDDWLPQLDDGEDSVSLTSVVSEASSPVSLPKKRLPSVVEDSEWDEAEILD